MRKIILALGALFAMAVAGHHAQAACPVPNPNLVAGPGGFTDNCYLPAVALNRLIGITNNYAGPAWGTTGYGNYDAVRISVNSYPTSGELQNPAGNTTSPTGLTVGLNVPSNALASPASGWGSPAIAGYALSASTEMGAVGIFGFGGMTAASVQAWGANTVVCNCATPNPLTETGFAGTTLWGYEDDINVYKLPNGSAPTNLTVYGFQIIGGAEVTPGAGSNYYAEVISPLGTGVPWQTAINIANGASTNGIVLGSVGAPGTTSAAQPLCQIGYNGNNTPISSCVQETAGGTMQLNPTAGLQFEISSVLYGQLATSNLTFYDINGYGDTTHSVNSVAIILAANNNAGSLINNTIQGIPDGATSDLAIDGANIIKLENGVAIDAEIIPIGGANSTSLELMVYNNGGASLQAVSLGAASSCGSARCLEVPN